MEVKMGVKMGVKMDNTFVYNVVVKNVLFPLTSSLTPFYYSLFNSLLLLSI